MVYEEAGIKSSPVEDAEEECENRRQLKRGTTMSLQNETPTYLYISMA